MGSYPGITPVINEAINLNPQPYPGITPAINEAINLNPQSSEAWNNKGVVLNHLGKYEEAIQAFDKAIEINPQLAQPWGNKGDSLKALLRYDEALQAYDNAIELSPQWVGPWIGKSLVLNNQKNAEGSKQAADRAIELDPQNALAWYAQGDALLNLGLYDEAVQSYDNAIERGKQNNQNIVPDAREHKGIALQRLDRITEANEAFSTAKEPVPYTDDQLKFTIQMPNGWAVGKATNNNRTFTMFLNPIPEKDPQGNIIFNENIHVAYDYLLRLIGLNITKVSLDDYFVESKTALAKSLQDYHLVDEREVTLGNTKGKIIEQTFTQNGSQWRSMQLFVQGGIIAYVITGIDLSSKWDIDKDLIEASLMSFRPTTSSPVQTGVMTFGGPGMDEGHSVQQTKDGGYIITGSTKSFGAGKQNLWLIKADANGKEMWNKTFGDLGDEEDLGQSVQQTTDGGYIITGQKGTLNPMNFEVWLIKTDASGNKLWDKTFGGSDSDKGNSVQQTSDGGYIITGTATLNLIKTDANGNMLWHKYLDCLEGTSVQQTIDGGYIIAGYQSAPLYNSGIRLIKTDANGNEIWSKTFGEKGNWSGSVQQTIDGGYIITGTYGSGELKRNLWLIKTDSNGNKLWDRIFYDSNVMICSSGQQTSDGGYVITGTKEIGDLVAAYLGGISDIWLIKTDSNGNKLWNKTFEGSNAFGDQAVQQTRDGGYVLTGATKPLEGRSSDVLLIKTDASGQSVL